MSAKKFKFVSPGVFLNEIDNSQLSKTSDALGPVIIGRARRGPSLRPVRLDSFSEFVEIFGDPIAGGEGSDVWREGSENLAPSYAAYAVQAYLRNSAPVNFVRLLGIQDSEAAANKGEAGWQAGSAYALVVGQGTSSQATQTLGGLTGSVAAIFYGANSNVKVRLSGSHHNHPVLGHGDSDVAHLITTSSVNTLIRGCATTASYAAGTRPEWKAEIYESETLLEAITFNFDKSSPKFIRKVFNTNPTLTNATITSNPKKYWLGESFEDNIQQDVISYSAGNGLQAATLSFTFSDKATDDGTLLLTAKDGTSVTFKAESDADLASVVVVNSVTAVSFRRANDTAGSAAAKAAVAATNFAAAVNAAGHNLSGKVTASVTGASVTLTQSSAGCGNTAATDGASWDSAVDGTVAASFTGGGGPLPFAVTLPFGLSGTFDGEDRREASQPAGTNWFISQDMGATPTSFDAANMQKLFRLVALDSGEDAQKNYKVSISNIVAARKDSADPYGSFTVVVRKAEDSDLAMKIVEQFSNCNLNPNSSNYVARKIGDMYQEWDADARRYKTYGSHPNLSKYFRVVVDTDVDMGVSDPELLPFGFLGTPKLKDVDLKVGVESASTWLGDEQANTKNANTGPYTGSMQELGVRWPSMRTRVSASHGSIANPKDAYFGIWTHRHTSSIRHSDSYVDFASRLPVDASGETLVPGSLTQYSYVFTLDDICQTDANNGSGTGKLFSHISGSRQTASGTKSITSLSASVDHADAGYRSVLAAGINKFTAPVYGGCDGLDITESEPFRNGLLRDQNERDSYEFASVRRALDSVSDPEVVECNMMAMPGITADGLTKQMLTICESRADALAVIDIDSVYTSPYEAIASSFKARLGNGAESVAKTFELRGINSSYGCAYYPWVKIHDEINDQSVWAPPSVVALGVMANTENRDALWFAPAGFNRGGLTEGSAGIPVLGVTERLTAKERDVLYDANINPIASFPSEGIVVFGQKTLQVTPSALDRINVRRLMIFVKKEVSRIAARLLFDQNVQVTWERFVKQVTPFLEGVKIGFGLSDFKVVLDASTTTPDLVDRNIMYAKIFLKPARAVEFIAVDFVITNTGAAFED